VAHACPPVSSNAAPALAAVLKPTELSVITQPMVIISSGLRTLRRGSFSGTGTPFIAGARSHESAHEGLCSNDSRLQAHSEVPKPEDPPLIQSESTRFIARVSTIATGSHVSTSFAASQHGLGSRLERHTVITTHWQMRGLRQIRRRPAGRNKCKPS
jgi:hypothetical protein